MQGFVLTPGFGLQSAARPATDQDMIILGGGPAGLAAALYGARAAASPLMLVGEVLGGQAATTTDIENYPGFPTGVSGTELAEQMHAQAERFGAQIQFGTAVQVNLQTRPFEVRTTADRYTARTLVITTGSSPRKLGVPGEDRLQANGVSYCATCDGYFYKDRGVVVVGGGNSAIDESLFLTRLVENVQVLHRRDQLRADPILQERAFANPKIRFLWNTVVEEILGDEAVKAVQIRNLKTGESSTIETSAVFVNVGHVPNTDLFRGQLELDANGYIVTDKRQRTSVPGVFAAGDVQDPVYRQIVTAAGTGSAAAIEAVRFLDEQQYKEKRE